MRFVVFVWSQTAVDIIAPGRENAAVILNNTDTAGSLVQSIDILGDDVETEIGEQTCLCFSQRQVCLSGRSAVDLRSHSSPETPYVRGISGESASMGSAQRLFVVPQPIGAAEGFQSCGGGYAGAGENHYVLL